ncbi:site-specific integrase [Paenibacillus barcinonensis]|uniref:Site-specific integrase n=1 Tax=Paenibacillus barcinonensis TaxID=198119 RepID=A0A2V4WAE8_PAEBA|nr:site-specific integrase [Paenibacillus barcinonensis]PYE52531.1 site-specific recombinase XerD [Paenibacillus barcinonensis]QKS59312.1 site-specific integrase [Paenibacillus barcinonensis]QKS59366.1 site-specific integrase [Paenibacillus barcinonensis]
MAKKKKVNIRETKSGKFTYRYDMKDPITGKRIQKETPAFDSYDDAFNESIRIDAELMYGMLIDKSKITFRYWAAEWIEEYSKSGVGKSTVATRKSMINLADDMFGSMYIQEFTAFYLQDVFDNLKEDGYARSSLVSLYVTLKMIFERAMKHDLVRKNVVLHVKVPKYKKTVEEVELDNDIPRYLEKDELIHFLKTSLNASSEQAFRIFFVLAYTGVRIGELCALKLSDFSEFNKTLSITKTLYIPNSLKNYEIGPPKTPSSVRKITISQSVVNILKEQLDYKQSLMRQHGKWFDDHNFIFFNEHQYLGYPMPMSTIRGIMSDILEKANLPESITPHLLRHTFTSLMAEAKVDLPTIQDMLGHEDDRVTERVYLHVTQARKLDAADKLDALIGDIF